MPNKLRNPKEKIMFYFDNCGADIWKTLDQIASDTKIDAAIVGKTLTSSSDFVRGYKRNEAGELLYTSRKKVRQKALIAG